MEKAVLKCLPISLLLGQVIVSLGTHRTSWDEERINDGTQTSGVVKICQLLLLGLALSCVGDALLVFDATVALFGMVSFAIAQGVYIAFFGLTTGQLVELSMFELLSGLVVLVLSLSILLLFSWRLNNTLKSGDRGMRWRFIGLVMPIALLYFMLISLMLWSALLQVQKRGDLVGVLGAIGALLFYVSDVLIAAGAIWRLRVLLHGRILVMVSYYGAQLLISLSVLISYYITAYISH